MPSDLMQIEITETSVRVPRLYEVAMAVRSALEDQFMGSFLLVAEIASLSEAGGKGHCYLDLADTGPDGTPVRMRANCWARTWRVISDNFLRQTGQRLAKGMEVLLEAEVTFHPQYGLSLNVLGIDPDFTLGRQKQQREQILARLQAEGLFERQQRLEYPIVAQRIAIISSPTAAGYGDFIAQLDGNGYDYAFETTLFTAVMQGVETEASICNALAAVAKRAESFDVAVIIRGGGAEAELASFDSYAIGAAIANMPLPVLTGIGHERDTTVPDMVAYLRLKTPTAVAEHLISHAADFEAELVAQGTRAAELGRLLQRDEEGRLHRLQSALITRPAHALPRQSVKLTSMCERITAASKAIVVASSQRTSSAEAAVRLLSPERMLARGYAILYKDGKPLPPGKLPTQGDALTARLAAGLIRVRVED